MTTVSMLETDLHFLKDIFTAKNIPNLEYADEDTKLELSLSLYQLEEE